MSMTVQRGTYAVLSQQEALWSGIETVANNMSNANTIGFKSLAQIDVPVTIQSLFSGKSITYLNPIGMSRDMHDGSLQKTGALLDVAIRGKGFFKIQTPNGIRYSRAGNFYKDPASGRLVTPQGYGVLNDGGSEITIPLDATYVNIDLDGTIVTNKGQIGKIGLADFEDPQSLLNAGDNLLKTDSPEIPVSSDIRFMQGFLEESNTDIMKEMVHMMTYHRMYEHAQKFMEMEDELLKRMINISPKNTN